MFLYDASFARLRELTLAYNLPADFAKRIGMRNAKVFATGMNLLTFSKYPGGMQRLPEILTIHKIET